MRLFETERASTRADLWFSSQTCMWQTPRGVFEELDGEFGFELDVSAVPEDAMCERFLEPNTNALAQRWPGVCWMNPPYGRQLPGWLSKARAESWAGSTVVCLVPARTDTAWFHDVVMTGEIRFIRGRLKFGGSTHNAPFPSMIVVFRPEDPR